MSTPRPPIWRRLPAIGLGLAMLSCYGVLALIGIAAALGHTIAPDAGGVKVAILASAGLAVAALGAGIRRHGSVAPLALAIGAVLLLAHALVVDVDRLREALAFALLAAAVLVDRRLCARGGRGR
jgi:hypothetical protein